MSAHPETYFAPYAAMLTEFVQSRGLAEEKFRYGARHWDLFVGDAAKADAVQQGFRRGHVSVEIEANHAVFIRLFPSRLAYAKAASERTRIVNPETELLPHLDAALRKIMEWTPPN